MGSLIFINLRTMKFSDYKIRALPEVTRKRGKNIHIEKNVAIVAGVLPLITSGSPEKLMGVELDHVHITEFKSVNFFEIMSVLKDIDVTKNFDTGENISTVKVLELCKIYGIKHDNDLQKQYNNTFGFDLWRFKYRLYSLYLCFAAYAAIHEENYKLLAKIIPGIDRKGVTKEHDVLEYAKEWLSLSCGNISVALKPSPTGFVLASEATGIISACRVFIALMAASIKVQGDQIINIKTCPNCGDFFSGHGNKKYCSRCDRRTIWAREQRRKTENR
jgi:ribosomal protein S27AE